MTCDDCAKEAYDVIIAETPQVIASDGDSTLTVYCKAMWHRFSRSTSFIHKTVICHRLVLTDGKILVSIPQTAAGSDLSNTSGNSNIALRPLPLAGRDAPASLVVSGLAVF